uniref:Ig-like domain-containing protein n=1 Tax=Neogobius melanostomus TaxID=47308 RepID=A0A8C6SV64_9GOBI
MLASVGECSFKIVPPTTSELFKNCRICLFCQRSRFLSLTVGDNITLRCNSIGNIGVGAKLHWYKQSLGRKPELVSSFLKYDKKSEFHGEFIRSNRVKLDNDNGKNDLYISDSIVSDSAVYHCVRCYLHQIDFLESYTVIVKSLNVQTKVHQLQHEDAEEGTSVTLNCSVHTGSCGGKPRVHWFKQSEESSPGVLYSHGGGDNDRCEETMDRPTNSCVYSLPIHNVSSEQTGTYYCAVAACGQVLFGNGTKIKIKIKDVGLAVYLLSGALAFSSIVVVVLAISLCKMKKRYSKCLSKGSQAEEEQVHRWSNTVVVFRVVTYHQECLVLRNTLLPVQLLCNCPTIVLLSN